MPWLTLNVQCVFDDEAQVWTATSDQIGLATEASTFSELAMA